MGLPIPEYNSKVEKLDEFDKMISKELNFMNKILMKYQKENGNDHKLFKSMVMNNLMKLDSDVDVFIQDTEEWMDKIGGGK